MKNTLMIFLFFLLCACHGSKRTEDYPILKVSLEKKSVSILELFNKFEIIPLETNDSSLLIWPNKVLYWDGCYEVFDFKNPALFVFNEDGKFIKKIGKKGDGPEEYVEIYDAVQDNETGEIYMLSPFGEVFNYSLEGKFIKRVKLPQKSNYQSFEYQNGFFVTWTLPIDEKEDGISIISKNTMQCFNQYWRGNRNLYFLYPWAFHKYGNEIFFFRPFSREVYSVSRDKMIIVYKWDFGKDNYSMGDWNISKTESGQEEESSSLMKKLKDSTIPYVISKQAQNNKYYYSELVFGFTPKGIHHIFYRKKDGKSFFFNETIEGINLKPLYWNDNFVLCLATNEDLANYAKILEKSDIDKISNRNEDDNPVLVKCYYR